MPTRKQPLGAALTGGSRHLGGFDERSRSGGSFGLGGRLGVSAGKLGRLREDRQCESGVPRAVGAAVSVSCGQVDTVV